MITAKKEAREIIKLKREKLSHLEHRQMSFALSENLCRLTSRLNSRAISTFLPARKEPNIYPFIAYALSRGIRVFVPVTDYENGVLFHSEIKDLSRTVPDKMGIQIPENSDRLLAPEELSVDLVVCPGTAFDLKGVRIGHGRGMYDRFLAVLSDIKKAGVCFEFQIFEKLENEEYDILMDFIVTEKRIIEV